MICLLGIIIVIIGVIIDQVTKYFASSYIKDNPIIIIEDILERFPDSVQMLEYDDYITNPTVKNASEFFSTADWPVNWTGRNS